MPNQGKVPRGTSRRTARQSTPATTGRTRFDDTAKAQLLDLVAAGRTIDEAVGAVGISLATVHRHRRADPVFRTRLTDARAQGAGLADLSVKFTPDARALFLVALREGSQRGQAARSVGVDPRTARLYIASHPEFREAMHEAERESVEPVAYALWREACAGNVRAIEYFLNNKDPEHWRDKRLVGIVGGTAEEQPVKLEVHERTNLLELLAANPRLRELSLDVVAACGGAVTVAKGAVDVGAAE